MKSIIEKNKEIEADKKIADFKVKQGQSYEFKKRYAVIRAREFVSECDKRGLNYHISVGGLDSITLLLFLRSIGINAPAISCSHLEDKSIQKIHKELGVINIPPLRKPDGTVWNKANIIQEFGFPVLSKEIASKIETLQNPTEKM